MGLSPDELDLVYVGLQFLADHLLNISNSVDSWDELVSVSIPASEIVIALFALFRVKNWLDSVPDTIRFDTSRAVALLNRMSSILAAAVKSDYSSPYYVPLPQRPKIDENHAGGELPTDDRPDKGSKRDPQTIENSKIDNLSALVDTIREEDSKTRTIGAWSGVRDNEDPISDSDIRVQLVSLAITTGSGLLDARDIIDARSYVYPRTIPRITFEGFDAGLLAAVGASLIDNNPDGVAVDFGFHLITISGSDTYRRLLLDSRYAASNGKEAAKAITATVPYIERDDALISLCRQSEGWDRVDIIEQILEAPSPRIKHWIQRFGMSNDYLTFLYCGEIIANATDLYQALADETIDDELFDGATQILTALSAFGPGSDFRRVASGPDLARNWIRHAQSRAQDGEISELLEHIQHLVFEYPSGHS